MVRDTSGSSVQSPFPQRASHSLLMNLRSENLPHQCEASSELFQLFSKA